MAKQFRHLLSLFVLLAILQSGCKSGPFNLIKLSSPHEQYSRKLISAGLAETSMGTIWLNNANNSLQTANKIEVPFQEKGYFAAERAEAIAYVFRLSRGEKINISLVKKPVQQFMVYLDLWEKNANGEFKLLIAADTLANTIQFDAEKTGDYFLRLQPELLSAGQYTLAIQKGPSLAFPLKSVNRKQIQSFWGAGRDNDSRKHEGIDIFAPFRTPVLAVANGTVTRVNMNNLGGKVVWFRPEGKSYNVYYAHLDEQLVSDGQALAVGDTLGRVGNTGNAINTTPHLHFGIYTADGAIDPLAFVDPEVKKLPTVNLPSEVLNSTMRMAESMRLNDTRYVAGTIVRITGAIQNEYHIQLPNGERNFVRASALLPITKPLQKHKLTRNQEVFDQPMDSALVKHELKIGQTIQVLGNFERYQLVQDDQQRTGWIKI